MVTQLLGIGDSSVDGGGAVNSAGSLKQDGVGVAVLLQLQGKALHPALAVVGDGVAVSQTIHQVDGGLQLLFPSVGIDGGEGQRQG